MTQAEGTSWMGPQGRFSSAMINEFVPDIASKTAHICGPPAMMDATKKMLAELGMPNTHIKTEAFGAAKPEPAPVKSQLATNTNAGDNRQVRFSLSDVEAHAGPDETVLDVADGLDVDIENSCRAGSCGSCKVKLLRGDVDMELMMGWSLKISSVGIFWRAKLSLNLMWRLRLNEFSRAHNCKQLGCPNDPAMARFFMA